MTSRQIHYLVVSLLAGSAALFLLAPLLMPAEYNWVSQSISETGAQQLSGAWATRCAFLALGLAVTLESVIQGANWRFGAGWFIAAYGFLMLTVAAFSTHSWDSSVPANQVESLLHSISATAMGFAYGIGLVMVIVGARASLPRPVRVLGWMAVVTSILMPTLAAIDTSRAGMYQRMMFGFAIAWFMAVEYTRYRRLAGTTHLGA